VAFQDSIVLALATVYPDHPWEPWRLSRKGKAYFDDHATHRTYFDWLAKKYGITDYSGWYSVKRTQFAKEPSCSTFFFSLCVQLTSLKTDWGFFFPAILNRQLLAEAILPEFLLRGDCLGVPGA
jgi:hypothetical protein